MRTITTTVYLIDEHPNPELCYDWIRSNWHDLSQHCVDEMIDSLKAFAAYHNVDVDYSIGAFPDRGEYIRFSGPIDFTDKPEGDCPLTGVCYDYDLIESASASDLEYRALKAIHAESEYLYADEGLRDLCEANEYEFLPSGKIA